MTKRANIFVPQTEGSEKVKKQIIRRMSENWGGATVRPNHSGYWVNDNSELIEDTVDIVFTYGDIDDDDDELRDMANIVKDELNEDAVMFSVEEANVGMV